MNFIIGYTVRPKNINRLSQVIYEEYVGEVLVEVLPTLDECEAYGFVFNNSDSKCYIANNPLVFNSPSATQNLSVSRASNTIGRNTRDNLIAGASHILTSNNYSNVISGDNNTVTDLVSNTTISGARAEATATNSIVLGGNASNQSNNPLGDELVTNGDFDEIGAEEILNGDFSEIGAELVTNGDFTPGVELVENGNFEDFQDATDSNLDGGVQFTDWYVNPSTGKRRLTNIVDGFRNDVIEKQTNFWQQRVYQSVSSDLEIGKYYRFKATFITSDASTLRVAIQTAGSANVQAGGSYPTEAGISQSIDIFFKCTNNTSQIIDVWPTVTQEIGESFYLQKVSLKEVGQEWLVGTGWSIGDNAANCSGINANLIQNIIASQNKTFKIQFTVSNYISGSVRPAFVGGYDYSPAFNTNGVYTVYINSFSDIRFVFYSNLFNGSVSNISVKEVGQDWVVPDGSVEFNNGAIFNVNTKLYQNNIIVVGNSYKVTYEITENVGGMTLRFYNGGAYFYVDDSVGVHTAYFVGSGTNNRFYASTLSGTSLTLKSISVKEVGQGWSLGGGWSIVDSNALREGVSSNTYISQTIDIVSGKTYNISYDRTYISGSGQTNLFSAFITSGSNTALGIYTSTIAETVTVRDTFTPTYSGNLLLRLYGISTFNGSVDNVSVKEVLPYLAPRQSTNLIYSLQSTDGSNNSSFLNGVTDSLFAIPDNTVMYFHADVIAVRVGGTDVSGGGLPGDFGSWVERGVIINKSGVLSISRERDSIKHSGHTTNWQPTGIVSGTNFAMRVRGHDNTIIEWASNITFTEIRTGVTL